jgi:flagellar protein FlbD
MIHVKRLNGSEVTINAALIESVESAPDTVIVLATGNRFIVQESVEEIIAKVEDYQRRIRQGGKEPNPIEGYQKRGSALPKKGA